MTLTDVELTRIFTPFQHQTKNQLKNKQKRYSSCSKGERYPSGAASGDTSVSSLCSAYTHCGMIVPTWCLVTGVEISLVTIINVQGVKATFVAKSVLSYAHLAKMMAFLTLVCFAASKTSKMMCF
jgi:hypothetical protein